MFIFSFVEKDEIEYSITYLVFDINNFVCLMFYRHLLIHGHYSKIYKYQN